MTQITAIAPFKVIRGHQFQNKSKANKAFIGLTIRAKIIGGRRPLIPEILGRTDRVVAKSPIFDLFSPVATQP